MDIRHLQHFLAVVETGSFHGAATRMNLTQQAISRSIKTLEAELGAELLERRPRDRRRVGPTGFGRLLLPRAQALVAEMQELRDHFDSLIGERHTLVRFGAAPTALRRLVPAAIRHFHRRRPGMRVQAMRMVLPVIIERLAAGAYDFVVGDEPDEPLEGAFIVEPLLPNRPVLVASPDHPLAGKDPVTGPELAEFRWVGLGPFMRVRTALMALFEGRGLALPANFLETSSLELVLDALRDPDVLTVLPRELVAPELAAGTLVEILSGITGPHWNIVLICRADMPRSPAVEDFVDALRATALGMPPG